MSRSRFARTLEIFTDGATQCNGQPNAKGGWGIVCPFDRELDRYGFSLDGQQTNNRYELEAIHHALHTAQGMDGRIHFKIYTDSKYAIGALTIWIHKWQNNGWKNYSKKPVKNRELIESTYELLSEMGDYDKTVELIHVKGHQDNYWNNEADRLARLGAEENDILCYGYIY